MTARPLGELVEAGWADALAPVEHVVHDLGEVFVLPVAPGEADEGEARWEEPAVGEVVHRRHQLFP